MPQFRRFANPILRFHKSRLGADESNQVALRQFGVQGSDRAAPGGRNRMNRSKLLLAACTTGALLGSLENAGAQFQFPFALPWSTSSVPVPAQAPKPANPSDWSGQPGSSGHPLMTTEAILAAAEAVKKQTEKKK